MTPSCTHRASNALVLASAGVVTEHRSRFCLHKQNGMVRDVFTQDQLKNLRGSIGIGHVRYPTAGSSSCAEAQPFYVNSPYGITLAHNGNLVGLSQLQADLEGELRHINTGSDSEVLLNLLASELLVSLRSSAGSKRQRDEAVFGGPTDEQVISAVRQVMRRCAGGYACVAMIIGYGLLAFRDPNGIRPLAYGRRAVEPPPASAATNGHAAPASGYEYMAASESGALNALGFELLSDVPPGHVLLLRRGREPLLQNCLPPAPPRAHTPCVFEYVYFARPDSVIDGISVYRTRLRMGEKLAKGIKRSWGTHDIDVVIPVPDTARTAAIECASQLGIVYREGFIKNRYVGRTFIMPAQGLRKKSVRQKLAPIASEFVGRNVLLVDDSIVRGTTSKQIIAMVREAGAKRVYMASAAPPVKFPNVYGIDMPTKEELIASHAETDEAVAKEIGADRVIYQVRKRPSPLAPRERMRTPRPLLRRPQELDDLRAAIFEESTAQGGNLSDLDCSCFDGKYVTDVGNDYLESLAATRTANRGAETNTCHMLDRLETTAA